MKRAVALSTFLLVAGVAGFVCAQEVAMSEIKYNKGQSLQPAFEGWMKNPDGSYSLWFGYLNRNYQEAPDVAIGANNGFGAGGEDLGQPTHFLPRRQPWAFKVTVPADWPKDKDVVWTVTVNGTTLKAFGSLWPVWEVDERIMSSDNGGRTQRNYGEAENHSPTIVSLPAEASVAVGAPLTLTVSTKDDGLPTPEMMRRGGAGGRGRGDAAAAFDPNAEAPRGSFRVKWVEYRAPAGGNVKFAPLMASVVGADGKPSTTDGKATTRAVFDKPGTYVVRAYSLDPDAFFVYQDVKVTVK